jgi:hypothetical protein
MKFERLRQNDPRWGDELLGFGKSTFGGAGCLMFDLLMAAHALEAKPRAFGPKDANDALKKAMAFSGSGLIIDVAAKALGLEAPKREMVMRSSVTEAAFTDAIVDALRRGLVILHVDHDSTRKGGDPEPDHFILAHALVTTEGGPLELECADPAPREERNRTVRLAWPELRGLATWLPSDVRRYDVLSMRPIRRAAARQPALCLS